MLKIEDALLLNKYGQDIIDVNVLLGVFSEFDISTKKDYLREIIALIIQSKPKGEDIELAIASSGLKPTFTPCVLLRKGVSNHNLERLINLPENEFTKVFVLLLSLFHIAYKRRFALEKENPDKWWYWDLSDKNNIQKIENMIK